jgi:lysophospholipase L1-like esterase
MKKYSILLLLAACARGQTGAAADSGGLLDGPQTAQLATRMMQLMESTAVAVPGLIRAGEPVKQNAQLTFSGMERTPRSPALIYQFMSQVKAYLALADSFPRPNPFPPTADQQFAELRTDLQRMQQYFEAVLQLESADTQKKESDPNDLKHYAEANSKTQAPGGTARVVFLGDATTEVWRLNEYFTGRDFVNRGIAGQTTQQMLGRFRQDVTALKPKAVVILAGSEDVAGGIAVNQIEDDLAMMAELAKASGIKTIFASILPVSDYHKDENPKYDVTRTRPPAAIAAINLWLEDYCKNAAAGCSYLNYQPALVDSSGLMQSTLSDDGLIPNAKALRVMSPLAQEAIGRTLGGDDTKQPDAPKKRRLLFGR